MAGASPANLLLVGRIGAAHGIKGEVRIQSFTEDPLALIDYSPLITSRPGLTVTIEAARGGANTIVARLKGIATRTEVEALNGVELFVPRDRLPASDDDDDFYIADLIGLDARLADATVLGSIVAVPNYGAGDILEIRPRTGLGTRLIPFTRAAVPEIHIADGYVVVEPPEEIEGEIEGDTTGGDDAMP
jgi:16S rRNA processing protein RimM